MISATSRRRSRERPAHEADRRRAAPASASAASEPGQQRRASARRRRRRRSRARARAPARRTAPRRRAARAGDRLGRDGGGRRQRGRREARRAARRRSPTAPGTSRRAEHGRQHERRAPRAPRSSSSTPRGPPSAYAGAISSANPTPCGSCSRPSVGAPRGSSVARGTRVQWRSRVLVAQVDVAVVDQRLRRQQVVRLVAGVSGPRPTPGSPSVARVDREQQQPEGGERTASGAPSARAMTICCTSSVPSPMVRIFASR